MQRITTAAQDGLTEDERVMLQEFKELDKDKAFGVTPQAQSFYDTQEQLAMVKHYTEENENVIPKEAKKAFWGFMTKAFPLTFLEEKDMEIIHARIQIARIGRIMGRPAYRTDFKDLAVMDQVETHTFIQAKRAIGTSKYKLNERTMHQSQFAQRNTLGGSPSQSGGGLKAFFQKMSRF